MTESPRLAFGFQTKDSGEHAEYSSGMKRDTRKGKPRFDLLLPDDVPYEQQMLTRWAALMSRGAEKYNDRNWEKARTIEELERYLDSAFRHFMQWISGEEDEDHAAAVMFNIMGAEYVRWRILNDDDEDEPDMVEVTTLQDAEPRYMEGQRRGKGRKADS